MLKGWNHTRQISSENGRDEDHLPTVGEVFQVQIACSQIAFWLHVLPCSPEVDQAIKVIEAELDNQEKLARGRARAEQS